MTEEKREPDWLPVMRKLHAARRKLGAVTKDAKNDFFKSRYATLAAVLDEIDPICAELNIEYLQILANRGDPTGPVVMVTRIIDLDSGSFVDSSCPLAPAKPNDPQAVGSAITYLRRYGLVLAFGVRVEDDDGNGASGRTETATKKGGNAGLKETLATAPKRGGPPKAPVSTKTLKGAIDAGFGFDLDAWYHELETCESLDDLEAVAQVPKKAGVDLLKEERDHGVVVYKRRKAELEEALPI
jgi:hypothetical protein